MKSAALPGFVADPTGYHLLAHQGGWDEVLLVVGPLAVVAGLLWLANKRVSAQLEAAELAESSPPSQGSEGDGSSGSDPRS